VSHWLRIELHCHTEYSPDSLVKVPWLLKTAVRKHLDRVAITDHNTIQGALEAKKIDPERIIVGEEIITQKGELLAYFVQEEIPAGLPPLDVIRWLREQGAFISVSHPFDIRRMGWQLDDLMEIVPLIDAIEVFNARSFNQLHNQKAVHFAEAHHLAGTAGSDAHTLAELGRMNMHLPVFQNADGFRQVIRLAHLHGRISAFTVTVGSAYARFYKSLNGNTPPKP
jgi:predicted metal-dependent phosphoesterase TrpH